MAKTSPLYRLEVVPLVPLFGKRDPRFSYASAEPVANGSLVKISFGKRNITGVTLDCAPLPGPMPNWMKMVGPAVLPGFLTPGQIALAVAMRETLFTPLNLVLKLFFPMQHRPRERKDLPVGPITDVAKQRSPLKAKKMRQVGKGLLFEGLPSDTELFERLIHLIDEAVLASGQILILVPEVLAAELCAQKIKTIRSELSSALLSSNRTPRETHLAFEAIKQGKIDIIIGTRQAIFAPFRKLKKIIAIDPEKRLSYTQWEMTPRYDTIELADFIAKREDVPYHKLSVAPGLAYFLKAKPLGKPFRFSSKQDLQVIDMRLGYHKRQANQALSIELTRAVREAVAKDQSILILVKQRGLTRFSLCAKCQTVLRCPKCQTVLTEMKSGSYHCLNCSYRSPLFPSCVNCGEMQFKSYGAGTEAVARELSRETKEGVVIIDRDTQTKKTDFKRIISTLNTAPSPLSLVSTYEAAESLLLPPLGLIALVEPDQGLFYPDYEAEERLWRTLHRFGGKLAPGGKLYVQTFEPESRRWTSAIRLSGREVAAEFLEERKLLHYPPYYHFLQLECRGNEKETSLSIAEKIEAKLRALDLGIIEVMPKFLPFGRKNSYHILIRYPINTELPRPLDTLLRSLDQTVKITHNPVSLQS
ncbi:MAG: hypothetical protein ACEQSB_00995 [Undibacterium sp.]